jgi:hypothetical protein
MIKHIVMWKLKQQAWCGKGCGGNYAEHAASRAWRAWREALCFSAVLLPTAGLVEHMHVAHCLSKICSENANKLIAQRLLLGSGPLDYTASIHTKHTPDFSR